MTRIDDTTQALPSQGPKGIWGWNTIPMLNLLLIAIMCFRTVVEETLLFFNGSMWAILTESCEAYNPLLGVLVVVECACGLVVGILCIYALILAGRRSSSYPRLAGILFWVSAIWGLIDNVAVAHIANLAVAKDKITGIIRGFVFAVIWPSYFMQSVRIKNTFVNASANWRRIRNVIGWFLGVILIVFYLGMQMTMNVGEQPFSEEEKESEHEAEVSEPEDSDAENEYPPIGVTYSTDYTAGYIEVTNKDPGKGYDIYLEHGSKKYFKVIPPGGQVLFIGEYWVDGSYCKLHVEGYDYVLSIYIKGGHYEEYYTPEEPSTVEYADRAPISAKLENNNLVVTNKDSNRGHDVRLELGALSGREIIPPGGEVTFYNYMWRDGMMGRLSVSGYDSYLVVYSLGYNSYQTRFEPKED